jgi:TonB family protein
MFSTLLESGRARRWRPAHSALSFAAHAGVVVLLLADAGARTSGASPLARERVAYAPIRFLEPARREASTVGGPGALPVRALKLVAPRTVPSRLPPVPAVDLAAFAVVLVTDISSYDLDPARIVPSSGEFLSGATDAIVRGTLSGYASHPSERPERRLIPFADNPAPEYPEQLRAARIEGQVRVAFVVDTTGVPDPESMRVLRSTHTLFTRAVRAVLPRLHFLPAQNGAMKVATIVEQPFVFVIR